MTADGRRLRQWWFARTHVCETPDPRTFAPIAGREWTCPECDARWVYEARESVVAWYRQSPDGFCTCDGDPHINLTCGIARHRDEARHATSASPWPDAAPEIEAAKNAVRLEVMAQGSVDLRAKRVITALWQRGWRPTDAT